METHLEVLDSVCRVGGERFGNKTKYAVKNYTVDLKKAFKLDVLHDNPHIHPQYLRSNCERALHRVSQGATNCGGGCGPVKVWSEHTDTNCSVCMNKKKAGRPAKRKYDARGKIAAWCGDNARPSNTTHATGGDTQESVPTRDSDSQVSMQEVRPGLFTRTAKVEHTTPEETQQLEAVDAQHAIPSQQHQQPVCTTQEERAENLSNTAATTAISCRSTVSGSTAVTALHGSSTVSDVLQASPSKLKGDTADKLMAHLVKAKAVDGKLQVKSSQRGRPQVYIRTTMGEVSSQEASDRTKRRRRSELKSCSESVCVGGDGARAQAVSTLRTLAKEEQEKLLQEAGLAPMNVQAGTALAIKADLRLPWSNSCTEEIETVVSSTWTEARV